MDRIVDYAPLTDEVTHEQLQEFKREAKASGAAWASISIGQGLALAFVTAFVAVFILAFASLFAKFGLENLADNPGNPIALFFVGFPIFVGLLLVASFIALLVRNLRGTVWNERLRLSRFAAANGFRFSPIDKDPAYPGAIFGQGSARQVSNHLTSAGERFLDIGNYTYTTGSGKNRQTHRWGFMALHLDRRLPHMVLDARANNGLFGMTNLPATFSRDQRLSLEGDFDKHFTLYAPREYETDALYVFAPDLMALLIDNAAPYDVEIVDDWMFVYSARPFALTDPAIVQRLLQIVDTVGAKTLAQTDRYVDDRVGEFTVNRVAQPGQRLRRGFPVVTVIVVAVVVVFWGLPRLLDMLQY